MKLVLCLAAAIGVALAACPASAQQVTAGNPDQIVRLLQDKGYRAELVVENGEDPLIRSADSGLKFTIFFLNCEDGKKCTTIQFYAGFSDMGTVAHERINEWNKTKRFARAYIDNEKDPVIEMDVNLDFGGVPTENFVDNLTVWTKLMSGYYAFLQEDE